jgi:hypothetical protein
LMLAERDYKPAGLATLPSTPNWQRAVDVGPTI